MESSVALAERLQWSERRGVLVEPAIEGTAIVFQALGKWAGEVEGKAVGKLITAIRVAGLQVKAAEAMLASVTPDMPEAQARAVVETARGMVVTARAIVRVAAFQAATAIPAAVLDAFEHFGQSVERVLTAVAEQAKEFAIGETAVIAIAVLIWLWMRDNRKAA